ncbi:MAG: hypothetical protein PVF47_18840, partial [Anaerolineae bacterium]
MDDIAPVDEYLSEQVADVIGLPLESLVRHVKTGNLRLFPASGSGAFAEREPLMWTSLGFILGELATRPALAVALSPPALGYGLLGVGLAVLALLVPALAATRHTIVTFKWERARALLRPLYQRFFLD